jgi:hypothetical protein
MKKFAIVAALTAAFIVPAQSQSYSFSLGQDQPWASDFAQAKKSQKAKQRSTKQRVAKQARQAAAKPCAAYYWGGCLGWDPDPHVRAMIAHDSNIFDD